MKSYPDASVIVSAFVEEDHTGAADAWLAANRSALVSSDWTRTEVASALARKLQRKLLLEDQRDMILASATALLEEGAELVAVRRRHFRAAADLLTRCRTPLRAGDALHLAIASDARARLVTLDRRMAEAGLELGLQVQLLLAR